MLGEVTLCRVGMKYSIALENLGIGNGGGKQGRGNRPPYRRYGPDTEIQYRPRKPHGPAKPSRNFSKKEADTEFQYRPHIVDTDTIADAVFADAISETSRKFRSGLKIPSQD